MSALIPFVRRNTLHDWIYDIDKFFEPVVQDQRTFNLAGDIEETESHILMSFDFPGMKQGDFSLKIEDKKLVIAGERKRQSQREDTETYSYYGRQYGSFKKTFVLPPSIDASKIEADYRDGVLRIALPKVPKEKEHIIDVKVGGNEGGFFSRLLGEKQSS